MTRVIGLISGTSVDGIDAALVDISGTELDLQVQLLAGETYPYPEELRERILAVCDGAALSMAELAALDDDIACVFAQAALAIQNGHNPAQLIGSHGQNVFHRPPAGVGGRRQRAEGRKQGDKADSPNSGLSTQDAGLLTQDSALRTSLGYSFQLGRGALIAQITGITTVSNFRAADIATGGQGAPLVPKIDACLLGHPQENRCIQNIGGIGNVAYIPAQRGNWLAEVCGWDTGPGNSLLDLAVQHLTDGAKTYDKDGNWAASGTPCATLVEQWLAGDYFHMPPPKSTGRELFGKAYLQQCLADAQQFSLSPADLLATLTELTVASIVNSYRSFLSKMPQRVLLCGGGSRNLYLKHRLQLQLAPVPVATTDEEGLSADFKEAIAFAVLAYWRQLGIAGNLTQVTGACNPVALGEINSPCAIFAI